MKWAIIVLSLVAVFIFSCQQNKQQPQEHTSASKQSIDVTVDMLAVAVDPNCGMDMHKTAVKDTTVYEGKLYGFCSTGCKTAFLKNPQEKLAKLNATSAE